VLSLGIGIETEVSPEIGMLSLETEIETEVSLETGTNLTEEDLSLMADTHLERESLETEISTSALVTHKETGPTLEIGPTLLVQETGYMTPVIIGASQETGQVLPILETGHTLPHLGDNLILLRDEISPPVALSLETEDILPPGLKEDNRASLLEDCLALSQRLTESLGETTRLPRDREIGVLLLGKPIPR
jgi:hypothetical protein